METMESPSEEQILKLLSTKYSVRIDTNLRKIEHAAPIDDLQEYGESEDTQVQSFGITILLCNYFNWGH